ncbi:PAS domain-containing hybrid sensor histidine kinase/response regulator [Ramlibacter rhizophilus]|uniref:histidine kinase n=1 Tax=Ramlibacter rhizophilus TaxID=1781167 RepID=A0A4Z0BP37_9BURK|nr:PAS domain-containing sensor histidine kinase [Ramlibacter rhizophilus]TFY99814.1 PAS domain-containing sensor histidine kinase [Ramlibacter rhizophilus]
MNFNEQDAATGSGGLRGFTPPGNQGASHIGAAIVESSPDCVKVMDLQGRLLRMNRSGQCLLEIEDYGSLVGAAWQSLWPAASRNRIAAALADARRGETSRFEAACPTAKGMQKWWDVTVSPIRRDGTITHVLAVSRDVTELVQMRGEIEHSRRILEVANQTKAAFAASISHEIRTPMNAMLGYTQTLHAAEADPRKRRILEKIQSAGMRLVGVVDDLLDISVADAGQLVLAERDFRLNDVLERVKKSAEDAVAHGAVRVSLEDHAQIATHLSGDPARLFQVLVNGTHSAMRLARREVSIAVRTEDRGAETVQLRFEITRDGPALSQQEIDRLLGDFADAHTASASRGGTGLGIAISTRLVRLMGGDIGFRNDDAAGSTFWFTVRLRSRPADGTAMAAFSEPPSVLAGKRVLLVDDDALNREVAQTLLEMAGVRVVTAQNGREAVETVEGGGTFDAVLMDMLMPVMNGLDATRALRGMPGASQVPVIAMTANVRDADRAAFTAAGANDFIGKPIDTGKLWSVVAHWTGQAAGTTATARAGHEDAFFQPTMPASL